MQNNEVYLKGFYTREQLSTYVPIKTKLIELYLDWVNNWLTLSKMADHYGLDPVDLDQLIHIGRKAHESAVQKQKPS